MVDPGIKKVVLKNNELPLIEIDSTGPFYNIRYRIVSEDKNRTSQWSSTQRLDMPSTTDAGLPYTSAERVSAQVINTSTDKILTVIWSHPQEGAFSNTLEQIFSSVNIYDIWIRWNDTNDPDTGWQNWEYFTTVSANTFSIIIPLSAKQADVAIQIPSVEKTRDNRLTLFYVRHNV